LPLVICYHGTMSDSDGHVLVTGCSTGIGRACAIHLAGLGFNVLAGVRKQDDAAALQRDAGANLHGILLDVTDAASISSAVETACGMSGGDGLRGLINNAGISVHGPVEHVPLSEWRRQFEVNFFGQLAVTQAMLPLLRLHIAARGAGSARIVMMSSIAGRVAMPIIGPYNASKFALEAMSDALRMELRAQGIKVCIVEPGSIDTPIWSKAEANPGTFPPDHPARVLYSREIDAVVTAAKKSAAAAIGTDAVSKVVEKCLMLRRPRTRYLVGTDAKIAAAAKWVLPTRVLDWGMARELGI